MNPNNHFGSGKGIFYLALISILLLHSLLDLHAALPSSDVIQSDVTESQSCHSQISVDNVRQKSEIAIVYTATVNFEFLYFKAGV